MAYLVFRHTQAIVGEYYFYAAGHRLGTNLNYRRTVKRSVFERIGEQVLQNAVQVQPRKYQSIYGQMQV